MASAIAAVVLWLFARGSDLELVTQLVTGIVLASLAVHVRRTAPFRVIKSRQRARRSLLKRRITVLAPVGDARAGRSLRIDSTVVFMDSVKRDEVIVRTDSPVSTTTNLRSDLLALVPSESGESFSMLLDYGRLRVGVWLVNEVYLSVRRGNVLARKSLSRNPTFSVGQGLALLESLQGNP